MVIRRDLHAGSWYHRFKPDLLRSLNEFFTDKNFGPGEEFKTLNQERRTIIGGISPHAGHRYSGYCAAYTFFNLFKERIPDTVVILGTDHIGYDKIALMEEGEWETPLGNLKIDKELSKKILDGSSIIINDDSAFMGYPFENEHNIEIQLPFVKYCAKDKDVKILPLKISTRFKNKFEILTKISTDIANAINSLDKDIVVIASSDMSHKDVSNNEQLKKFKEIDQAVINQFIELNPKKTLEAALKTSVCGPQTITSLILICKELNASKAKFLQYYTSSEKEKTWNYCVGYFSGIIIK